VAQHLPDRRRDVSLREHTRRHLVEQWLEQVIVGAIHDRDVHRCPAQRTRREQPAEPGSDDHGTVSSRSRAVCGSGHVYDCSACSAA
jgi:hypothetical protein